MVTSGHLNKWRAAFATALLQQLLPRNIYQSGSSPRIVVVIVFRLSVSWVNTSQHKLCVCGRSPSHTTLAHHPPAHHAPIHQLIQSLTKHKVFALTDSKWVENFGCFTFVCLFGYSGWKVYLVVPNWVTGCCCCLLWLLQAALFALWCFVCA